MNTPENRIIHIMGPMGAGKGVAAAYLKDRYGFTVLSFSAILKEELVRRGLELSRENFIETYYALRKEEGDDVLARKTAEEGIKRELSRILFDGGRNPAEPAFIKENFPDAILLYVDSLHDIRKKRIIERKRDIDPAEETELEKVMAVDLQDAVTCRNVSEIIIIENNEGIGSFKEKLDSLF